VTLERLRAGHAEALPGFERENREYFARAVPDRGDAYFAESTDRHHALLAERAAGIRHFHVVLDADGQLVGRVNLVDVADGTAELGYRVAERAAGRGVATAAVRLVCEKAATEYGLRALTAVTTLDNAASRAVPRRCGFTEAGPLAVDSRPGLRHRRELLLQGARRP